MGAAPVESSPSAAASVVIPVVASSNVYGDIVEQIGGDKVKAVSIISDPAQDPHSYEAGTRNQLELSRAEVVVEIRDPQAEGHTVAMVGDGTNDAPALALALADVGISMGEHSSHVALETADIALAGNDLRQVPAVVELRHTLRVVRQNYGLAIGVNLVGLIAGAGGSMNPVLAALLHNTSSIAVVGNSARLVNHAPHLPRTTDEELKAAPLEDRRVR